MDNMIALIIVYVLSLVAVAIVTYYFGYKKGKDKHKSVIGVYRFDKWNGDKTVVLILNEDMTCTLPTGNTGVWVQCRDTIKIISDSENNTIKIVGDSEGIVYNSFFFEKVT